MFNVYLSDGNEIPEEQACYIVGKDGVYLKKNLGMIQSVTKVDKISFLESVSEQAQLNVDPIPVKECARMLKFFRDVCETYNGSEAIALLYYNQATKKYKIEVPPQIVSGGACDFKREVSMAKQGYNLIGDIHTHGNGSAFHSGTDDADEKTGVDGLHITFGHVGSDEISISTSITVNGKRFTVEPYLYLDGCMEIKKEAPVSYAKTYKYIDGQMVEIKKETTQTYSYLSKRYKFSMGPKEVDYPKSWFEKVEYHLNVAKRATYATESPYNTRWNGYTAPGRWAQNQNWEKHWNSLYGNLTGKPTGTVFHKMVEGEYSFCEECKYKKLYLKAVADGLISKEHEELNADDGSAAYVEEVEKLVEDQLTSDDFLNSAQSMENIPETDEAEIPSNLEGKPQSWIREFFGKLKS
jgi:PRTRC genetic system protein A